MTIETRPNDEAGKVWLAAESAAGSYMLVNEKVIRKLTGEHAPQPTEPPTILSARQFWIAIEVMGYTAAMEALIEQLPTVGQLAIRHAGEFDRTFPQFLELAGNIASPAEIEALFEFGATL